MQNAKPSDMNKAESSHFDGPSLAQLEDWSALTSGAGLLLYGFSRRSTVGLVAVAASAPLLYRGLTGQWPLIGDVPLSPRTALAGNRSVRVREAVRLERPIETVYRFWRRLENLPSFMSYLDRVSEDAGTGRSHWVASGPGGVRVEWDAEIINEIENKLLAWQSLPGSDIITAGSVNFDRVRDGRSTQVTVNLQYAPPAGRGGAALEWMFGRAPSHTIREDLRHFKQVMEAGELANAQPRQENRR
jgi:uncharacterized membrane protein